MIPRKVVHLHPGLWKFHERYNHPANGTPYYTFVNENAPVNCRKFAIPVSHFWG